MVRIFDPVVREVEKLVSYQVVRVKLERMKAGKPQAIRVPTYLTKRQTPEHHDVRSI